MRGGTFVDKKKMKKFNFYRNFFYLIVRNRKLKWNMWWFQIILHICMIQSIDNMEIYQSVMTFVIQCNHNLNYLCPFLVTETCINNRWMCAIELRPKHSRNNKEANHMTFLRRVKFVSCPHMKSFRFWSYLSFLSRLSRRADKGQLLSSLHR